MGVYGRYADAHLSGPMMQYVEIVNLKNGAHAFGLVRDECLGCAHDDLGTYAQSPCSACPSLTWSSF